jgi:hypothetical protein
MLMLKLVGLHDEEGGKVVLFWLQVDWIADELILESVELWNVVLPQMQLERAQPGLGQHEQGEQGEEEVWVWWLVRCCEALSVHSQLLHLTLELKVLLVEKKLV